MSAARQPPPLTKFTGGGGDGGSSADPTEPTDLGEGERPILKRRVDLLQGEMRNSRLPDDYEFSFDPSTMVGSWFHRLENDRIVWQGVVVAEPRQGVYLVQIDRLDVGAEDVQRLVDIANMVNDEEGYDWRFYDSREIAVAAYAAWVATERERV